MNVFKSLLIIVGMFLYSTCHGQNDTIIKPGFANLATLIVDYDTYAFEGGNISYYSCTNCNNDSLPFLVDYDSPGDFGGITFNLIPTLDTVFHATIIWMGLGQIYHPSDFQTGAPFNFTNSSIEKPLDLKYLNFNGVELTDPVEIAKADLAWDVIDSLQITHLFSNKGVKAGIYFYPPTVGAIDPSVAKWIIFLYHFENPNSITHNDDANNSLVLYPNPTKNKIEVTSTNARNEVKSYTIFNQLGVKIKSGQFENGNQIDLSTFPTGLYFLELKTKNWTEIRKIVKE